MPKGENGHNEELNETNQNGEEGNGHIEE